MNRAPSPQPEATCEANPPGQTLPAIAQVARRQIRPWGRGGSLVSAGAPQGDSFNHQIFSRYGGLDV
jgi:hypothetical protein